jgi:hypothetical protein
MATKMRILHEFWGAAALAAALVGTAVPAAGAPMVGDAYTYRLVNGYNKEVRGQVLQEVTSTGSARVAYSVTPDSAMAGWQHTVVVTPEGNGLRLLIDSHGEKIEYEFAAAYPAYVFPLDAGKSWSLRVKAAVANDPRGRSVRVDGKVIGAERIRVPAGEFDTIKVQRRVYPGDEAFMLGETQITETDWYAPALGRPVRTERRSNYFDHNLCGQMPPCEARGDWDIYELVEVRVAKR